LTVIAESRASGTGQYRGTSENYAEVRFQAKGGRLGELHAVRILSLRGLCLEGRGAVDAVGA